MESIIVQPRNEKEAKFLTTLFKKLDLKTSVVAEKSSKKKEEKPAKKAAPVKAKKKTEVIAEKA